MPYPIQYAQTPTPSIVRPRFLEGALIRTAHPTLVTLKHDTAAFVPKGVPLPTGPQSASLRPELGGHAWNADLGVTGVVGGDSKWQQVSQIEQGVLRVQSMTVLAFGPQGL